MTKDKQTKMLNFTH